MEHYYKNKISAKFVELIKSTKIYPIDVDGKHYMTELKDEEALKKYIISALVRI
jgi:hypothetical protein